MCDTMQGVLQVVLDTNVLVAGLRSRRGAAFRVLELIGRGRFQTHVSVPLLLEYEYVVSRHRPHIPLSAEDLEAVLDYHCAVGQRHEIFFLWRPFLRDPSDDMVLELAVKARCDFIVTYNGRDFTGCERFGVETITPVELLRRIGEIP